MFVRGRRFTDPATLTVVGTSLVAVGVELSPHSAPRRFTWSETRSGSKRRRSRSSDSSASRSRAGSMPS